MTPVRGLQLVLTFCAAYVAICGGNDISEIEELNKAELFEQHNLCSTECKSSFCFVPPALRYGKYCGIGYSGCDGQEPCDGLDACCQTHDKCIGSNLCNYLNVDCNQALIDCLNAFENSGSGQFPDASCGTADLVSVINAVIEIGVEAGKKLKLSGISTCKTTEITSCELISPSSKVI